ncbi:hypothetical protein BJY04DRAFT_191138 [Aspergillus karnatakaensis]|uniref:uncharacterized protein n=1 Tax=Aspergillus karnatakaensis TaxID=1810916 RepID=UPI003CCE105B
MVFDALTGRGDGEPRDETEKGRIPTGKGSGSESDGERERERVLDPDFLVKWDQDDQMNPQNWPARYKWWVTFQLGMLALAGSLGSSIFTPAHGIIGEYVGVSQEVAVLDVALYL